MNWLQSLKETERILGLEKENRVLREENQSLRLIIELMNKIIPNTIVRKGRYE